MLDIFSNILANGLYDILKRGAQSLDPKSRLYDILRERQLERLYQDSELQKQIELYRKDRSQEALAGIKAALEKMLQKDKNLAASVEQILASEETLREVMNLTAEQNISDAVLPPAERFNLIRQMSDLSPEDLELVIFTLNPPPRYIPPIESSPGRRAPALLKWAEGPTGCGLDKVQQVLKGLINPQ
jgi:DNA-binding FrmR family transcriptional regulator